MAKTTICAICGKEIKKGLFTGENVLLEVAPAVFLDCCQDCYDHYEKIAKQQRKHFEIKLENYKWENRKKVNKSEIALLYKKYIDEAKECISRGCSAEFEGWNRFYMYSSNGVFGITESRMGFLGSDVSAKDKIKTIKNSTNCDAFCFTKDDINCIKFRLCNSQDVGLFSKVYSVEICLNDSKLITFKPAYVKTVIMVKGIFSYKHKAVAEVQEMLARFKADIGSNLPIEMVKKFR